MQDTVVDEKPELEENEEIKESTETSPKGLNNLMHYRNTIWGVILGISIVTLILLFTLNGWIKLIAGGAGILTALILFFLYKKKNAQIISYFDELFTMNQTLK